MPEADEGVALATTHALVEVEEAVAHAEELTVEGGRSELSSDVGHELDELVGGLSDVTPVRRLPVRDVSGLVHGLVQRHLQALSVAVALEDLRAELQHLSPVLDGCHGCSPAFWKGRVSWSGMLAP